MELARSAGSEALMASAPPRPSGRPPAAPPPPGARAVASRPRGPRRGACRAPCAGRRAGAAAACRRTSGSGPRPDGTSSPSSACGDRPSGGRRGPARWRRRRPARRCHQPLLRAGHRDVDAPGVHLERHAAERGHASTISSAGCPAASIARRIAAMSLATPEAVSIWTTRMALISRARVGREALGDAPPGSTARRGSPFNTSTLTPIIRAMSPQPDARTARSRGPAPSRPATARC